MTDRKLLNIELGRIGVEEYRQLPGSGLVLVLDNIRSAHNVGSAFRTADSFRADKLCLCGISALPPSAEIHKTALGAEFSVPWEHYDDTLDAVRKLREEGYVIVSVEQTVNSRKLENVTCQKSKYGVMIVGFDNINTIHNINLKNCNFTGVYGQPVYITGQTDKPNYENLVINGSQVLSQLPYKTYSQWMAHSEMQRNPDPCYLDFAKTPKWGYVVGIEQEALLDAYLSSKDESIINYLKQYPAKMIDEKGNITGYEYSAFNLDNTRPARFILRMNELFPEKKNELALCHHTPSFVRGCFSSCLKMVFKASSFFFVVV